MPACSSSSTALGGARAAPVEVDLGANPDIYLARVDWFPDGRRIAVQRESRDQKTLTLLAADPATGATTGTPDGAGQRLGGSQRRPDVPREVAADSSGHRAAPASGISTSTRTTAARARPHRAATGTWLRTAGRPGAEGRRRRARARLLHRRIPRRRWSATCIRYRWAARRPATRADPGVRLARGDDVEGRAGVPRQLLDAGAPALGHRALGDRRRARRAGCQRAERRSTPMRRISTSTCRRSSAR